MHIEGIWINVKRVCFVGEIRYYKDKDRGGYFKVGFEGNSVKIESDDFEELAHQRKRVVQELDARYNKYSIARLFTG